MSREPNDLSARVAEAVIDAYTELDDELTRCRAEVAR
jgi:hypothetical protein